ncbi:hypothetical protein [Microbulbifer sp. TYP-18]
MLGIFSLNKNDNGLHLKYHAGNLDALQACGREIFLLFSGLLTPTQLALL